MQIYLGTHTIILVPVSGSHYKVNFDGKNKEVSRRHPIMLSQEELIYAVAIRVNDQSSLIEIHAKKAGIKVVYDGKNAKVQVNNINPCFYSTVIFSVR